jgi:transcriptional repressor NrdR
VALRKRPAQLEHIEKAANEIVRQLETQGEAEISSKQVGELVMKALIDIDVVGYIRYASVYKDFRNPGDFDEFLQSVKDLQESDRKARNKRAG